MKPLTAEQIIAAALVQRPDPAEVVALLIDNGWTPPVEGGRTLSEPTIAAIKAALQASLREVGAARHDYAPIHDFQRALDEIDAMTTPARNKT